MGLFITDCRDFFFFLILLLNDRTEVDGRKTSKHLQYNTQIIQSTFMIHLVSFFDIPMLDRPSLHSNLDQHEGE